MADELAAVAIDLERNQAALRSALYAATNDAAAAQDAEERKDQATACLALAQALALVDPSVQPAAAQPGDQSPGRPKPAASSPSTPQRST